MKAEREIIKSKSVPEIQTYCAEHGLHFQLIDMPWAEKANLDMCLPHQEEIVNCKNLSIGPSFIVRLFPLAITLKE